VFERKKTHILKQEAKGPIAGSACGSSTQPPSHGHCSQPPDPPCDRPCPQPACSPPPKSHLPPWPLCPPAPAEPPASPTDGRSCRTAGTDRTNGRHTGDARGGLAPRSSYGFFTPAACCDGDQQPANRHKHLRHLESEANTRTETQVGDSSKPTGRDGWAPAPGDGTHRTAQGTPSSSSYQWWGWGG